MCGIFGCFNSRSASEDTLAGLQRLEYRGYDSWGLAAIDREGALVIHKAVGQIALHNGELPTAASRVAIGHTRWATHGEVNLLNAHPHRSADGRFALVHNGVIENAEQLRKLLIDSEFESSTDTEVLLRLIEFELSRQTVAVAADTALVRAACRAFSKITGRNAIIVIDRQIPQLIGLRNRSPLVVGLNGATTFIASDTLAFADKCPSAVFPADMQGVQCKQGGYSLFRISDGLPVKQESVTLARPDVEITKNGYPHFMIKEILDQGKPAGAGQGIYAEMLDSLKRLVGTLDPQATIYTSGAGSAYFTAAQTAYFLRTLAKRSAVAVQAYEVESYLSQMKETDLFLAVSQSGETADTVEAAEKVKEQGVPLASIVNMPGATLSRMSDFSFSNQVGPELCVLSTKSACSQMAFGYIFARTLAGESDSAVRQLEGMAAAVKNYITPSLLAKIHCVAEKIHQANSLFVLGKAGGFHLAQVGALNIKEASYIHAEGVAAGELKHGVIALVEKGLPLLVLIDSERWQDALLASTAEVKSRGAFVIGVSPERNRLFDVHIPMIRSEEFPAEEFPLAQLAGIIPAQLLAYNLAVLRGFDPDRPRNLAKSVTVL